MEYGSSASGYKKFNAIEKYLLKPNNLYNMGVILSFCTSMYLFNRYYLKMKHETWIEGNYGDYVPVRETIFSYTGRYYIRMVRVQLHNWKLVNSYFSPKANDPIAYHSRNYDIVVRRVNYLKKRDSSFDFINPGVMDIEYRINQAAGGDIDNFLP